jgi:hypothetical protein
MVVRVEDVDDFDVVVEGTDEEVEDDEDWGLVEDEGD